MIVNRNNSNCVYILGHRSHEKVKMPRDKNKMANGLNLPSKSKTNKKVAPSQPQPPPDAETEKKTHQIIRPKEQLLYLSELLGFEVSLDFLFMKIINFNNYNHNFFRCKYPISRRAITPSF